VIRAILIFNNLGKQWLSTFYLPYSEDPQQQTVGEILHLVSKKGEINFLQEKFQTYIPYSQISHILFILETCVYMKTERPIL
uniref:AP complex mu/sigma subunit domain-containing protein n=2 Tax=Canis lupus familiaris TaxID=9615 RepID=A0A8C0TNB0_CANLF